MLDETESDVFAMTKMMTDFRLKGGIKPKSNQKRNQTRNPKSVSDHSNNCIVSLRDPSVADTKVDPRKTVRLVVDERESDVYNHLCTLLAAKTDTTRLTFLELSKRVLPLGDFLIEYTIPPAVDDANDVPAVVDANDVPAVVDAATDVPVMTGTMIVERKSLSDLIASIRDGRYEEQSYRLTHASALPTLHNVVYIIEGVLTSANRALVHSTMTSLNHFKGFSVLRTASSMETAEYLLAAAGKIQRNLQERKMPWYVTSPPFPQPNPETDHLGEGATNTAPHYCTVVKKVKKENITPQNIAEIMLCQLPGISSTTAMAIVAEFPTMKHLLDALVADPSCLNGIRTVSSGKSRRMSQSSIDKVKWCLLGTVS
jgi:ERCC4-type nuclease